MLAAVTDNVMAVYVECLHQLTYLFVSINQRESLTIFHCLFYYSLSHLSLFFFYFNSVEITEAIDHTKTASLVAPVQLALTALTDYAATNKNRSNSNTLINSLCYMRLSFICD